MSKSYWIYFNFVARPNLSVRLAMKKVDFDFVSNFAKDILMEHWDWEGSALIIDADTGIEVAIIDL